MEDKWDFWNESFWDWLKGNAPNPGESDFIGPPTMGDSLNKRSITNPFTSTKIDDYLILIAVLYGVYRYCK
jgi:hypothetical protein